MPKYIVLISIVSFYFSYIISTYSIPTIKKIGVKYEKLDFPDERKKHKKPIVRIGGISIFISFLIASLSSWYLISRTTFSYNNAIPLVFITSTFLFFSLGLIEDIKTRPTELKLLIHILFSTLTISLGFYLGGFSKITVDLIVFRFDISYFIFLILGNIWIVGITNAINWIDGLDGLATINSIIIALAISLLNFQRENYLLFFICLACIGSLLGFIRFNKPPASIFMGDGGSFFLGSFLAISSILSFNNYSEINKSFIFEIKPILLFLLLSWPLLDLITVFFHRTIKNISPLNPDRNHIHHKLLKKLNNEQILELVSIINIFFCSIALFSIDYKFGIFFILSSSTISYLLNRRRL